MNIHDVSGFGLDNHCKSRQLTCHEEWRLVYFYTLYCAPISYTTSCAINIRKSEAERRCVATSGECSNNWQPLPSIAVVINGTGVFTQPP